MNKPLYMGLKFKYIDSGFLTFSKFSLVKLTKCTMCAESKGRGFQVGSNEVDVNNFVCLECMPFLLQGLEFNLEDTQELGFFDLNILLRYSQLHMRYLEGKIKEENYLEHRRYYEDYIYPSVISSLDLLAKYDLDYKMNITKGTKWQGWWEGASGAELNLFSYWLRTIINSNCCDNIMDEYKKTKKTNRIPIAIKEVQKLLNKFHHKFKVEKKFKR